MEGDKTRQANGEGKIREDVGWTVRKYLKKLLEKSKNMTGFDRILYVLGITKEMLKEMDVQQRKMRIMSLRDSCVSVFIPSQWLQEVLVSHHNILLRLLGTLLEFLPQFYP